MNISTTLITLYWILVGAAVGSFLNVAADRLVAGDSLLQPPSRCPSCGKRLPPLEMVPLLSYLALRGRCRTCGAKIGLRTLLVEAGSALLFGLAALSASAAGRLAWLDLLFTSTYLAALLLITVTDWEQGLILDRVTFPALALAALDALRHGWPACGWRLGGAVIGAGLIALIIYLVPEGMGWGDAKLCALLGASLGLPGLWFTLFIGFVSGGLIGGVLLATGGAKRGDRLPLGPFLTLGGAVTLLYQPQLLTWFNALSKLF
ncbi:MAG TPA: prepilin peptidase [Thermoflexia bacterium]|nr:prepilin peptidase [Thermoflexia bacterium]